MHRLTLASDRVVIENPFDARLGIGAGFPGPRPMLAPPTTYTDRWDHVTITCISIHNKSGFINTSRTYAAVRAISKNLNSKNMHEPISVSSNTRVGAFIQPQGKKQAECMNRDARTELVVHACTRAGKGFTNVPVSN